ncbi:GNAT family N-acetyltransferase [soil metagenome]
MIRTLTPDDTTAYRTLRLAALREQPPAFGTLAEKEEKLALEEVAARLQASEDTYLLGAFVDDNLVGTVRFARFEEVNEQHRGLIAGMYVAPDSRRRGVARALLGEVLVRARALGLRRLHLTVVTGQVAATKLYESFGFEIYGTEREAFFKEGRFYDEYLMALVLKI